MAKVLETKSRSKGLEAYRKKVETGERRKYQKRY